jgi:hypothetical protein
VRTLLCVLLLAQAAPDVLTRAGLYTQAYFGRAQTIVSRERVRLQPIDATLHPVGEWRQLEYEVRVEWDPSKPGEPVVTRRQLSSGGRVGTLNRSDSECFDMTHSSPEPLAMLLPQRLHLLSVTRVGRARSLATVDFTQAPSGPPSVTWTGTCGAIELNGNIAGRLFIDAASGAVHRIEQRLTKPFQFVVRDTGSSGRGPFNQTLDRLESVVQYKAIVFRDPDETLLLPETIRLVTVIENSAVPRLLTLYSYDRHRRFVTGGRVVP